MKRMRITLPVLLMTFTLVAGASAATIKLPVINKDYLIVESGSSGLGKVAIVKEVLATKVSPLNQSLLPAKDNTYSLGSSTLRWKSIQLGPGTLYIQDQLTGKQAGLTVRSGALLLNGADSLRIGNIQLTASGIKSTRTSQDITIGAVGDTGLLSTARGIKFPDGTIQYSASVLTVASIGATGPIGLTGLAGLIGATGLQGAPGISGLNGAAGPQGTTGPQGASGETGLSGAQGIQGEQGITGSTGARGLTGAQGVQGPQGERGDKGEKGEIGDFDAQIICVVDNEKMQRAMYWGDCKSQELSGEEFTILKEIKR